MNRPSLRLTQHNILHGDECAKDSIAAGTNIYFINKNLYIHGYPITKFGWVPSPMESVHKNQKFYSGNLEKENLETIFGTSNILQNPETELGIKFPTFFSQKYVRTNFNKTRAYATEEAFCVWSK